MSAPTLKGKVVVIAGGGKNLGALIANQLADGGATGFVLHYNSDSSKAETEQTVAGLKAKGMTVNEITPAEQKRMFDKVKPVYDKNVPTIGAEAVGQVLDALKKARGG